MYYSTGKERTEMSSYNRITNIKAIPADAVNKLIACGLRSLKSFLHYASSTGNRQRLSRKTGISELELLKWAHLADLYRIKGIGAQYLVLLQLAAIRCIEDLQQADATLLLKQIEEINRQTYPKIVDILPVHKQVESWIQQANEMEPLVETPLVDTIMR